jgi:hypothetical protein
LRTGCPSLTPECGIGSEYGLSGRGGYCLRLRTDGNHLGATTFVSCGRSALALAIHEVTNRVQRRETRFLLPSYLCHTVIQPFEELGIEVAFYDVGSSLQVRVTEIAARMDSRTAGILVVQYFGFPHGPDLIPQLRAVAPETAIIDDRTHTLLSDLHNPGLASEGAIRVYSARKWLPVPDLGIVAWPSNGSRTSLSEDAEGYNLPFALRRLGGLLLRSLFFAFPCEYLRSRSLEPVRGAESILDRRTVAGNATPISTALWRHWNWRTAWESRRRNFLYLLANWPRKAGVPLRSAVEDDSCPLGFPIRTPERDALRRRLIAGGVYPPVHWILPKQVPATEFAQSACLAAEELTIPIDQRYGLEHMDLVLEAVERHWQA